MSLIMPNGNRTIPYGGDWMKGQPRPQQPQQGYPQRPTIQRPGQAQPQQDPYGTATPYGGKPQSMGPQWNQGGTNQQQSRQQPFQQYMSQGSPYGGGNQSQQQPAIDPNVANNPYANRPPPFQATTQNFDGTQSEMPNYQQQYAFISQINNQLGQMQNQSWQQPGVGAPQFDFPQMWGQAGEMAQQGFQNPFAQAGQGLLGTLQQQSTPSMYRPPQQGGISARELGIGPSVTYRQPDGGVGHTPTSPASPPKRGADNIQADPGMMDRYRSDLEASRAKEADYRKQMDAARGTPQYENRARLHRLAQDEINNTQFMIDYYSPGADQRALVQSFERQNNARRKMRQSSAQPPAQSAPPPAARPAAKTGWVRQLDGSYAPAGVYLSSSPGRSGRKAAASNGPQYA